MKQYLIYIFLTYLPLALEAMEQDYNDFLENALRAEFTDLPETKTLKELKILYTAELINEFTKLLNSGIDISDFQWQDLLRKASYLDKCSNILKLILDIGLDPNTPDIFGMLPIYYAYSFEALHNVDLLLKHGAKVSLNSYYACSH